MKLITFVKDGRHGLAASNGGDFHGSTNQETASTDLLLQLIASGESLSEVAAQLLSEPTLVLDEVTYLPPVQKPAKILCVGFNYAEHATELEQGKQKPDYPELFTRFATTLIAHKDTIRKPKESEQLDYEVELAVIMGKRARRVSESDALSYIAGYTIANDATLRDYQFRTTQWTAGKNFDLTGALGPALVLPEALPPGCRGLKIEGRLNGKTMQSSSLDSLIFDVPKLISIISEFTTLEPGDVIMTGTPSGVGMSRDPKVFMQAGDTYEAEIENIGVLTNSVIDDSL